MGRPKGIPMSEEWKASRRGSIPWNKGTGKVTISKCIQCSAEFSAQSWRNQKLCSKLCSGNYKIGKSNANKGRKATPSQLEGLKAGWSWNKGKKFPERSGVNNHKWDGGPEARQERLPKCIDCGKTLTNYGNKRCHSHMGLAKRGENSWNWVSDRSLLKDDSKDRGGQLSREWSRQVKNRDGWKCKISNDECNGRMESHHILSWKDYESLRYDINNGITLCHFHHPRKREEEVRLRPYFEQLITSQGGVF